MQKLDLRAMFYCLLARIKWIIAATVIGAVLLGAYAKFFVPTQYISTAMLYFTNVTDDSDASVAERLVQTVRTASTATWALQQASTQLNHQLTPDELVSSLTFSAVSDTSFLKISVTHTDPVMAQKACNVMAETAVQAFVATGETGKASVYQPAVEAYQVASGALRLAATGGIVGLFLSMAVVLILPLFNNTVLDKEDVQRRLNVPVLGEIPCFEATAKGGSRKNG